MARKKVSRRMFLGAGSAGAGALAAARLRSASLEASLATPPASPPDSGHAAAQDLITVGDIAPGGLDPSSYLTDFDGGAVSTLPSGQTLRQYELGAVDREIEIAPGIYFPAWTYNGRVPGPTIRARQGDRIRIRFRNAGAHPHTIHFHGFHPAAMDGAGVAQYVHPGENFVYEFDAEPFGLHLYHCHTNPLKRHIHKGLYGAFIVDPPEPRPPARELLMVMNGFDTNFDDENEVYAVNSVAFHFMRHPIRVRLGEPIRIYLVNLLEFDLLNSFHLHAHFFHEYRTGTRLEPGNYTDTVMLCQGERSILEFEFRFPGQFMFHAHQTEFAELGWMGLFEVQP